MSNEEAFINEYREICGLTENRAEFAQYDKEYHERILQFYRVHSKRFTVPIVLPKLMETHELNVIECTKFLYSTFHAYRKATKENLPWPEEVLLAKKPQPVKAIEIEYDKHRQEKKRKIDKEEDEFNIIHATSGSVYYCNLVRIKSGDVGGRENFEKLKKAMTLFNHPLTLNVIEDFYLDPVELSEDEKKRLCAIAIFVFGIDPPCSLPLEDNDDGTDIREHIMKSVKKYDESREEYKKFLPEEFQSISNNDKIFGIYDRRGDEFSIDDYSPTAPLLFIHYLHKHQKD